jgi:hypothetical protein
MDKNSHLKGLQQLGPLTVLRADMDEEGSFDDAVAGCDYVFLVAAPVNLAAQDPEVHVHARTSSPLQLRRLGVGGFRNKELNFFSLLGGGYGVPMAERADRAVRPRHAERDAVVREGRDGAARDPDLVGGRSLHQAGPAATARRRARAGRGVLVRRRVPQSQQATNLGPASDDRLCSHIFSLYVFSFVSATARTAPYTSLMVIWTARSHSQGYCVSKVLLEKEACRFAGEHGISLVTVCPVITVGAAPAPKVRTSIIDSLSMLSGE